MSSASMPGYAAEVGTAIRRARRANRLTQPELGRRVGLSTNAISAWERGRSAPSIENLRRLCEVLDVDPRILLVLGPRGGKGERREPLLEGVIRRLQAVTKERLPDLLDLLHEAEAEARELRARL